MHKVQFGARSFRHVRLRKNLLYTILFYFCKKLFLRLKLVTSTLKMHILAKWKTKESSKMKNDHWKDFSTHQL